MDLFSQYTRITNYNKLIERFITAQVKDSSRPSETGRLFTLVEIMGPWNINAHVGQAIINTLSREYFRQKNTNELINFENALKKVNEKLVAITQNGETDWIGKINAILVLIKNDKIHVTYTGKIKAYLIRNNDIMPIIQGEDAYSYHHPLRTFSSVTSGELKAKDRLFFSTNGLFDIIDTKNLKEVVSDQDLLNANMQIASILKSRNLRNANCILVNMGLTDVDRNQLPEVIYIDEQQFNYFLQNSKRYFEKIKLFSINFFGRLKKSTKNAQKYYKEQVVPKSKNFIGSSKNAFEKSKKYTQKNITPAIKKYKDRINQSVKKNFKTKTPITPNKPETKKLSINHYSKPYEKVLFYWKKFLDFCKKVIKKIQIFIKNAILPKNRSKTYIVIALILLVIFVANIGFLQKINSHKEQDIKVENMLNDLENKKDDALLAKLSGNNEKAKNLFEEVLEEINTIGENKKFVNRISSLKQEVEKELDSILNIDKLTDSAVLVEFTDVDKFFIIENDIYGISYKNSKIYKKELNSTKSPEIIATVPASENEINASSQLGNEILLITQKSNLYKLNQNGLVKVDFNSMDIKNSKSIKNFLENIYILDPASNEIYKSTSKNGDYPDLTKYLTANYDLADSIDMAIDGYIYILKKDGKIAKFSLGKETDFNLRNIPESGNVIKDPKQIIASEDMENIYILSANQIIEIKKDGEFVTTYKFKDDISQITDFSINPKAREINILNDSILYKFNMK